MKLNLSQAQNRFRYAIYLFARGFGKYKMQIILLALLGFLSGILEGIGINAIVPLMSLLIQDEKKATDPISQSIENVLSRFHIDVSIIFLVGIIIVLFLLKSIVTFIAKYFSAKIQANYERNTRIELFQKTLDTHWPYLLQQKIGHLEKVLLVDIGVSSDLLVEMGGAILLATSLFIYVLIAFNINYFITVLTLSFGGILFLVLKPFIYKTRIFSQKIQTTNKLVSNYINENMIGIKTIKSLSAEATVSKQGDEFFNELRTAKTNISYYSNLSSSFIQPISMLFISAIFAASSYFSTFNFGSFLVIIYLVQKIFSYIQSIQSRLQSVNQLVPFLESVVNFRDELNANQETAAGTKPFHFEKTLEFKNVSFSYDKKKKIIANLSFEMKKGEMLGLIGPSGAGKTTIVDLILGLIHPTDGKILIDGEDISSISIKEWRKNIGYVSQDIFLLNDTIENNIRFYDNSITDKEIIESAKLAQIYDFTMEHPKKFKTVVGERGVMLSGGQRQRVILARMLCRKPKILILDEATSALDNESELLIQKAIENLKGKITVLAVAHRLTTVMNSHRLIAIEKGKIIEHGTPEKLLSNKNSYFYKMYNIRQR